MCENMVDTTVSTLEVPGLGMPFGLLVLADGTRLVGTLQNRLQLLTPAGLLATLAGDEQEEEGFEDGKGPAARFHIPGGMTVDAAGHIVVADSGNNALRRVSGGLRRRAGRCRALQLALRRGAGCQRRDRRVIYL